MVALVSIAYPAQMKKEYNKQLFDAAKKGDVDWLNEYFEMVSCCSYIADEIDDNGHTLFHAAILSDQNPNILETVKCLIKYGLNVNLATFEEFAQAQRVRINANNMGSVHKQPVATALHCAAMKGNKDLVELLIKNGARLNSQHAIFENTPLHLAAWFNHSACVEALLAAGADVSITNNCQSTPVHSAAWRNSLQSLKILAERGASLTNRNGTGLGNTPLYLAAKAGSTQCVRYLIEQLKQSGDLAAQLKQRCATPRYGGTTSCVIAFYQNHMQCCWDLMVHGAEMPNVPDEIRNAELGIKPAIQFIDTIVACKSLDSVRLDSSKYQSSCGLCGVLFCENEVITTTQCCMGAFHFECFKDHFLRLRARATCPSYQAVSSDILHDFKTKGCLSYSADKTSKHIECPSCNDSLHEERDITLYVFNPCLKKD